MTRLGPLAAVVLAYDGFAVWGNAAESRSVALDGRGITMQYLVATPPPSAAAPRATPPIIFCHGSQHGAWCFGEHWLDYFALHGHTCYALNFRGTSGCPLGDGTRVKVDDHVADLEAFARHIAVRSMCASPHRLRKHSPDSVPWTVAGRPSIRRSQLWRCVRAQVSRAGFRSGLGSSAGMLSGPLRSVTHVAPPSARAGACGCSANDKGPCHEELKLQFPGRECGLLLGHVAGGKGAGIYGALRRGQQVLLRPCGLS